MEEESYFGRVEQRSIGFYLAVAITTAVLLLSFNSDMAEYSQHESINIPGDYFVPVLVIDLLQLISLLLVIMFRKPGVFLFPLLLMLHFLMHLYYLSTVLYSDLVTLFFYFAAVLFVVVPRWKFFR